MITLTMQHHKLFPYILHSFSLNIFLLQILHRRADSTTPSTMGYRQIRHRSLKGPEDSRAPEDICREPTTRVHSVGIGGDC